MIIFGSVGFIITFLIVNKLIGVGADFIKLIIACCFLAFMAFCAYTIFSIVWKFVLILLIIFLILFIAYAIYFYYHDRKNEIKRKNSKQYKKAVTFWEAKKILSERDLKIYNPTQDEILLHAKDISNERADEYLKGENK